LATAASTSPRSGCKAPRPGRRPAGAIPRGERPAGRGDTHWHCAGAQRQCKCAPTAHLHLQRTAGAVQVGAGDGPPSPFARHPFGAPLDAAPAREDRKRRGGSRCHTSPPPAEPHHSDNGGSCRGSLRSASGCTRRGTGWGLFTSSPSVQSDAMGLRNNSERAKEPPNGGSLSVRWGGVEPPRLAAHGPQPCLSASSSTSARVARNVGYYSGRGRSVNRRGARDEGTRSGETDASLRGHAA